MRILLYVIIQSKQFDTTKNMRSIFYIVKESNRVVIGSQRKRRETLRDLLLKSGRGNDPIEVVYVIGTDPGDDLDENASELEDARVVLYDSLLDDARESYEEYLRNQDDAGRVSRLIERIDSADIEL